MILVHRLSRMSASLSKLTLCRALAVFRHAHFHRFIAATSLASVQRMVKHFELPGLVCRVRHESRSHLLSLTPAGLELYRRLHPAILAVRDRGMASLSERERETLQDLVARVISANELQGHPSPLRAHPIAG
jgi:hypothetical protein